MPPKPDPHIHLTVKSTSGSFDDDFNRSNRAQKVVDDAIKRFNLATGPGITYVLRREADNRTLSLAEKLGDLGLTDPDVVLLQTSQAQDG
jgi:hypothetical protein